MDRLKQVPHITIKSAKPITDIPDPKLSMEFLDAIKNFGEFKFQCGLT